MSTPVSNMTAPLVTQNPLSARTASRIFLIDDHPLFLHGLVQLLEQETDCCVCGKADDGDTALALIAGETPDLIILDVSLPGGSGIDLLKRLKVLHPQVPVLMLSMHDERIYAERTLRAGARGYLMKDATPIEILRAIWKVLEGETYLSEEMSSRLRDRADGKLTAEELLTNRELEVLAMFGRGESVRTIAETLGLSVKTVETHRANLKEKLRLETSADLIRYSMQWLQDQ